VTQFGSTPVSVSDDVLDSLAGSTDWLKSVQGLPGGRSIARVLEAKEGIDKVRQQVGNLRNSRNVAENSVELRALGVQISELLSDPSGVNAARAEIAAGNESLGALKNLYSQLDAQIKYAQASSNAAVSQQRLDAIQPTYDAMTRALDDYRVNGLNISLSDANSMRAEASGWAESARRANHLDLPRARTVNDAMRKVGVAEVPQYGATVKAFREAEVRATAQETGSLAARGKLDTGTMAARITQGRLPKRAPATGDDLAMVRQGAREGAVRQTVQESGGTPAQVISSARRITTSQNTQMGLRAAAPGDAGRIERAAGALDEGVERLTALARPTSPTLTAEQLGQMKEMATGAFFGTIGGAAKAGLVSQLLKRSTMSRGAAERTIDMLGNPQKFDQAVEYMIGRDADVGAFFGAMVAATAGENE